MLCVNEICYVILHYRPINNIACCKLVISIFQVVKNALNIVSKLKSKLLCNNNKCILEYLCGFTAIHVHNHQSGAEVIKAAIPNELKNDRPALFRDR